MCEVGHSTTRSTLVVAEAMGGSVLGVRTRPGLVPRPRPWRRHVPAPVPAENLTRRLAADPCGICLEEFTPTGRRMEVSAETIRKIVAT